MSSPIYTKTGDRGTTSLNDGSRVPKHDVRIEAYGTVDEANSWLGMGRAGTDDALLGSVLTFVQHRFYNCSSNLATPAESTVPRPSLSESDVVFLERAIDAFVGRTGAIGGFVVPGGNHLASVLHVARTVCRRAERRIWQLAENEEVDVLVLKFINRASDLLFAAARYAATLDGAGDVLWDTELVAPKLD